MSNETFSEFKNSFSYGPRNDLNFKFFKGLADEDVAQFFQDLLWKLGETINDGQIDRLIDHVVDAQTAGYMGPSQWAYDDGPLVKLSKPLNESRIGILSSTGSFVEGQDPNPFGIENMSQEEAAARIMQFLKAAPELSEIPLDTQTSQLRARHGGYDVRGVQADPNVAMPIHRLQELEADGIVGTAVSPAYSFVGAAAQSRLNKESIPQWVELFKEKGIEGAVLVPVWPVCHMSVGHVARALEEAGITTVIIAAKAFRDRLEAMKVPRLVVTPYPMGRPLGAPNNTNGQRKTLLSALELMETAVSNGTTIKLSHAYFG